LLRSRIAGIIFAAAPCRAACPRRSSIVKSIDRERGGLPRPIRNGENIAISLGRGGGEKIAPADTALRKNTSR